MSRARRVLLERLDTHHDVSTFDSGNDMLDGWLRRHALAAQRMDSARTFVATRGGRVVGYFSLTMGSVLRADAPAKLVRGMPAYPVGMVLLARLAVDQSQQGKGVGAMFLAEALRKAVAAGEVAAATSHRGGRRRRQRGRLLRAIRFRPSTRASAATLPTYEGRSRQH